MRKSFQGQVVLHALNLEMQQGEFLTLLGPSGCGKTTTLNIVAGLLEPDSGTVFLRGQPANRLPARRRGLGLVFQSWALFPHMTVFDNIAYGLRVRAMAAGEIRRRVGEMLDLVRLPGIETKYPSQLSGGMQQRVALARALVPKPDLLLLDEPLSNLDAALRKEMQVELRRIHTELHVSTLLVTHSQEEALVMSDRIAVMRGGRLVCLDTPIRVYNHPPDRFVCTFLGPANIFACRVEAVSGAEARLSCGSLRLLAAVPPSTRVGQALTVGIRPEGVVLMPEGDCGDADVAARVEFAVFKGSHIEYQLVAGENAVQALSLPPVHGAPFGVGDRVRLSFPKHLLVPLAGEATDA